MNIDLLASNERDIFDEQRDHTFAFDRLSARIVPHPQEIGREGEDTCTCLRTEKPLIGFALPLVFLLECIETAQMIIPVGFQAIGDEAIIRVRASRRW